MSEEEIEKIKQEAATHEEEDKKVRELIEVKNMADALINTAEKAVQEAREKISQDIKKTIEEKVEELKKVKDGDSIEEIKAATEALSQAAQKMVAEMYSSSQASPPGHAGIEENAGESDEQNNTE